MLANVLALASTVILLVVMGYFMLGSLPLLVLKHDTPLDARFIRGFFDLYYRALLVAAGASALAYAVAGKFAFFAGLTCLAAVAFVARRRMIPQMDAARAALAPHDQATIRRFRRLHIAGMLLNFVQLMGVASSLLLLRL
jgi:hypothetical protein